MSIGIVRLNARHQPPTPHITFIKPLPGASAPDAEALLSRVAAICHPILRTHHLCIMSLEEHEPNAEFVGRNFNAGEVIQLVLRTRAGAWLPFRSVVMVMMHELAHCVQMNHSGAFWKVRDLYAEEMRGLWGRGYTGEGVWGRGREVGSGEVEEVAVAGVGEGVRGLCGGTFRSGGGKGRKGRKRKRKGETGKVKVSYAERQQRRIARKFGVGGVALGDDEEVRGKLEEGRRAKGKPRVAGSVRGRELRAAAALARFGGQEGVKQEEESGSESETGSEFEDEGVKKEEEEARDLDGSKLLDLKGRGMIKVCENEDPDDVHVKAEMQELQDIKSIPERSRKHISAVIKNKSSTTGEDTPAAPRALPTPSKAPDSLNMTSSLSHKESDKTSPTSVKESSHAESSTATQSTLSTCPICSMANAPSSLRCTACSHVLDPRKMPGHWRCKSPICKGSLYVNAADCGLCGACGGGKPVD